MQFRRFALAFPFSAEPGDVARRDEISGDCSLESPSRGAILPEQGRQSPRQQLETRNVSKVAGIQGDERRAMDKRLSSDHAVQQLSARIPDRFDDLPVRIGGSVIESEYGQRRQHRIQARPANSGLSRVAIHSPFELDSANDRQQDRAFQRRDLCGDRFVAVAQMDCDVGVQQKGQASKPRSFR